MLKHTSEQLERNICTNEMVLVIMNIVSIFTTNSTGT